MVSEKARTKEKHKRDDLTGEHAFGDAGQIILACLFLGVWIADTFFFQYTTFLNGYVPFVARIPLGALLLILSAYLARTGLAIVFGDRRETPAVIRKSVFGVVRHPVYLSEILFYLGLLMLGLSLAAAGVGGVTIVFLHYISKYEEKLLLARFGEDYAKYMQEVPMWLPRFWKS
ncbi:MAG: isoprenylcysteine carboxylmethyltransferase family protein [Syntrophaceae bacterium]|nr:isoprenylcysteine carboxylmethyltransferase family protein [Syntrophaceae bacterium]